MTSPRPLFSIVSAVYNVEPYLGEFIASVEAQTFDLGRVEVIAVDDGSTDGSRALLEAWAARHPGLVTVIDKPNGGQASARNLGLERATGEWVTFSDPDDMLDRGFLAAAARFLAGHPDVEALTSLPEVLLEIEEGPDEARLHPRHRQYRAGNRVVDLRREPNVFFGTSAGGLFRMDRIRAAALRFDERVRPNFEDGHFAVHYLLGLPQPLIGILSDARYIYRKRASRDSTLQRSYTSPGRYSDVLEFGYLDVLREARDRLGSVPAWLQQLIVYELSWYLSADEAIATPVRIPDELVPRFHELLGDVVRQLDPRVVRRHSARRLKPLWVDILSRAFRDDWHSPIAARTKVDREMRLQRVHYRFVGRPPAEEFVLDGTPVHPAFAKTRAHIYYRRPLLYERILWLPAGRGLRVVLDGSPVRVAKGWPRPGGRAASSGDRAGGPWRRRLRWVTERLQRAPTLLLRVTGRALRVAARTAGGGTFRGAWVVMDRIHNADDNGQRLFEYLRRERPDINAWFVLEAGTPDWRRMRAAGVDHMVAHGSLRWMMLMLNCEWLVSSHADRVIEQPPQLMRFLRRPTWKYAFLQHGVMKDDLSVWLNRRDIDMFVVSTQAELESVVADGTGYVVTAKETRNTGLPRFDRLLAKGREVRPADRDLVLIAPTWRTWLAPLEDSSSYHRQVHDAFWESDYRRCWDAVIRSPEVAAAAARHGRRIGFMPHPNLQPILPRLDLPAHVEPLTFAGNDAQALYARCALLVTDYSSVAFNAAYLDRPVVYFQFDPDEVLGGGHLGRRGYHDYERDGFGPVVTEPAEAVAAIVAAIERGPEPDPEYQARIDRTFPVRDGRACERVVAAIEELSRPYRPPGAGGR